MKFYRIKQVFFAFILGLIISYSHSMEVLPIPSKLGISPKSGYLINAKDCTLLDVEFFVHMENHVKKHKWIFSKENETQISSFLEDLKILAKEQLLLRSENSQFVDSITHLNIDYNDLLNLGNTELDHCFINKIGIEIQTEYYNERCSTAKYKASRYEEQLEALQIVQRECCEFYESKEKRFKSLENLQIRSQIIFLEGYALGLIEGFFMKYASIIKSIKEERVGFLSRLSDYYKGTTLDLKFAVYLSRYSNLIELYKEKAENRLKEESQSQYPLGQNIPLWDLNNNSLCLDLKERLPSHGGGEIEESTGDKLKKKISHIHLPLSHSPRSSSPKRPRGKSSPHSSNFSKDQLLPLSNRSQSVERSGDQMSSSDK